MRLDRIETLLTSVSNSTGPQYSMPKSWAPVACPCCSHVVTVPTLDIAIDHYKLTPLQSRILRAVWKGQGAPVKTERIFHIMYEDDPDGGPEPKEAYRSFKVAIHHLRRKLAGSGITIENCGYRHGYRLAAEGNDND